MEEENNMRLKELELEIELEKLKQEKNVKLSSDELNELYGALAKAQGEIKHAVFNKSGGQHKNKYADLPNVITAIKEAFAKNGLCYVQRVCAHNTTGILFTRIGHISGQWIESRMQIPYLPKNFEPKNLIELSQKMQQLGGAITYARRYALSAMVGISHEEDTDLQDTVSPKQYKELLEMIGNDEDLLKKTLSIIKLSDLADLPSDKFEGCLTWIQQQKGKQS